MSRWRVSVDASCVLKIILTCTTRGKLGTLDIGYISPQRLGPAGTNNRKGNDVQHQDLDQIERTICPGAAPRSQDM